MSIANLQYRSNVRAMAGQRPADSQYRVLSLQPQRQPQRQSQRFPGGMRIINTNNFPTM